MDEKIFDRVEKKYLIDSKQQREILQEVKKHMQEDGYYKSEVYNIYFDTDNYDLIVKSIERPHFKEKLRARSYDGYDKVFLEIKTKIKGEEYNVGYKRRVLLTHKDYNEMVSGQKTVTELAGRNIETESDMQIAKEVEYMISYFGLKPKILVYYNRESYVGEQGLRLTFDTDLSFRDDDLSFKRVLNDRKYFKDSKNVIMEIKAHGVMPLWLVKTLSRVRAYPQQFSKIGKIYAIIKQEGVKNV